MKKTYLIAAYNQESKMNEIFYVGLSKTKANNIASSMKELGAKHVKVELEK